MSKKYELVKTDIKISFRGQKLFRIRALKKFGFVQKGDLGGYIAGENNLDQNDNAWVYGNARVSGNARVYGDAWVSDNAQVYGNARVYGDALVSDNARVSGNARVYGDAQVYGNARVYGDALVYGNARVYGDAQVYGNACVSKYGECININNQKKDITVTPNLLIIGCKQWKTLDQFITEYKEIGLENGYSEEECENTRRIVEAVWPTIMKKESTKIKITHDNRDYEIDIDKARELGLLNESEK